MCLATDSRVTRTDFITLFDYWYARTAELSVTIGPVYLLGGPALNRRAADPLPGLARDRIERRWVASSFGCT